MDNLVVIVTGATGSAGRAVCRELLVDGKTVIAVGHDSDRLAVLGSALPGLHTYQVDLAESSAVRDFVADVRDAHGRIDGLVHLVGGWRGRNRLRREHRRRLGLPVRGLIDTLRHLTLELHQEIANSPTGRVAIVSSTAVSAPTAGNANYVAAKAAAEAWMLALADAFIPSAAAERRCAPGEGHGRRGDLRGQGVRRRCDAGGGTRPGSSPGSPTSTTWPGPWWRCSPRTPPLDGRRIVLDAWDARADHYRTTARVAAEVFTTVT